MDYLWLFPIATAKVGADYGMGAFNLMIDGLADIMKQTCALCRGRIKPKLACHNPA